MFLHGLNGKGGIGNGGGWEVEGNQGDPNGSEEFVGGYSVP